MVVLLLMNVRFVMMFRWCRFMLSLVWMFELDVGCFATITCMRKGSNDVLLQGLWIDWYDGLYCCYCWYGSTRG